jgi:hypothetical protein
MQVLFIKLACRKLFFILYEQTLELFAIGFEFALSVLVNLKSREDFYLNSWVFVLSFKQAWLYSVCLSILLVFFKFSF